VRLVLTGTSSRVRARTDDSYAASYVVVNWSWVVDRLWGLLPPNAAWVDGRNDRDYQVDVRTPRCLHPDREGDIQWVFGSRLLFFSL